MLVNLLFILYFCHLFTWVVMFFIQNNYARTCEKYDARPLSVQAFVRSNSSPKPNKKKQSNLKAPSLGWSAWAVISPHHGSFCSIILFYFFSLSLVCYLIKSFAAFQLVYLRNFWLYIYEFLGNSGLV